MFVLEKKMERFIATFELKAAYARTFEPIRELTRILSYAVTLKWSQFKGT